MRLFAANRFGARALTLAAALLIGIAHAVSAESVAKSDATREIVARVGEQAITLADLQIIAVQNGYDLAKAGDVTLALRDATNQEILAAEARRRGYQNDPEIQRYVRSRIVERLVRESVDGSATVTTPPSDAELRAYYDQHIAEFTPPTVAQGQILALLRRNGDDATFPARLAEVQAAIRDTKAPFGELINRYSDDPAGKTYGGVTNWLVKGEPNKQYPPALLDAIFGASDSEKVAGPIAHNSWVYFARLKEKREGKPATFEQSRSAIAQKLVRQKRLEAYDAFVRSLAGAATVQTFPEKVSSLVESTARTAGPPAGPVRPRP